MARRKKYAMEQTGSAMALFKTKFGTPLGTRDTPHESKAKAKNAMTRDLQALEVRAAKYDREIQNRLKVILSDLHRLDLDRIPKIKPWGGQVIVDGVVYVYAIERM